MKISENIVSQWPELEDETVYLAEVKTQSRRPFDNTVFYSTIPMLVVWSAAEGFFVSGDNYIALNEIVDLRCLRMDPKYYFCPNGAKEWPD